MKSISKALKPDNGISTGRLTLQYVVVKKIFTSKVMIGAEIKEQN